MGLQNAIITKISDAEIRTTHVTGMITDIGIEPARALFAGCAAHSVLLEALLLGFLALHALHTHFFVMLTLLSFSMGLQNAIITKISEAEIRTTHVTGMLTDIGIELGKALYFNRSSTQPRVRADGSRLALLSLLVMLFFGGGALGAFSYPRIGFMLLLPLATGLAVFTVFPIAADLFGPRVDS